MKISRKTLVTLIVLALLVFQSLSNSENLSTSLNIVPTSKPVSKITPVIDNQLYTVSKVIDGDTFEITGGQKVRMIGIDTPEISANTKCFGLEAKQKAEELLKGKQVRMEKDVSETDKYGRLLRYVYVQDVFINELLVKEGYASVATYPPDVKYQQLFTKAQQGARLNKRGLWGSCK